jgi:hypothetical protein
MKPNPHRPVDVAPDLVERLRSRRKSGYDSTEQGGQPDKLCDEAADALATLSANLDAMRLEVKTATAMWKNALARGDKVDAAEAEVARLKLELGGIKWKSADRDNMEFSATITCYQMDAIRAFLPAKKEG